MADEEIVAVKLRQVNEYTKDLKEIRGLSRAEYVDDMITQRAVERTLMNLYRRVSTLHNIFEQRRVSRREEPQSVSSRHSVARISLQQTCRKRWKSQLGSETCWLIGTDLSTTISSTTSYTTIFTGSNSSNSK